MNPVTEYRQSLVDAGFSAEEADRIVRWRAVNRKSERPGRVVMEKTGDGEADLLIYEAIGFDPWTGDGLTPKKLTEDLAALGPLSRITLRINSPGGDVFDAVTMLNILRRQQAKISVEVEGLAASAASFLAQAADPGELRVSDAGMFMVHRAWALAMGNTKDMADMAVVLEKLDGQIANIYAGRSGRRQETWLNYMDAETWFTGAEAVEAKLADKVIATKRAAACIDPAVFAQFRAVPEKIAASVAAAAEEARQREAEDVEVQLRILEIGNARVALTPELIADANPGVTDIVGDALKREIVQ